MFGSAVAVVVVALALGVVACVEDPPCTRHSDCPYGLLCTPVGTCAVPADAATDALGPHASDAALPPPDAVDAASDGAAPDAGAGDAIIGGPSRSAVGEPVVDRNGR